MDTSAETAIRCPLALREVALRSLHKNVPKDLQAGLVQAIDNLWCEKETSWDGLFICQYDDQVSAVWAQLLPGQIALLWPPAADIPVATRLLREVGRFLDQQNVALTQLLLEMPQGIVSDSHQALIQLLTSCDYCRLVNLQYLMAERLSFPLTSPNLSLTFESQAEEQPQRLAQLIEKTYIGTCDCPAVDGIRPMSDVLASYRSTGRYRPELWFFVQHQGLDVGALLLALHGNGEVWELVYMGIVPAARGQGFGCQIVQQALWQTAQGEGRRLVLAVDESNGPALAMYHRGGLVCWDRRQVYTRFREGRSLPAQ